MRQSAVSILLFVVACASPQSSVPRSSTVYFAPTVRSRYVESELSHALVAEFDRRLRLAVDMVQVGAHEQADHVVQTVVSFAAVEMTDSTLYGDWLTLSWNETLIGTVTVTARIDPTHPVVAPIRVLKREGYVGADWVPLPVLLRSMAGCRIDAVSGAVTAADGSAPWLPGIAHVEGIAPDLYARLGLPLKQIPPRWGFDAFSGDPGYAQLYSLSLTLSTRLRIDNAGPGEFSSWQRVRSILWALVGREQLSKESLSELDRRLLSSLLDRIAVVGGDEGEWTQEWDPAPYGALYGWLVTRMRDDYEAFREGYKKLIASGVEPAFCKAVYERWPPNPDVFRNAYVPASTNLHATPR